MRRLEFSVAGSGDSFREALTLSRSQRESEFAFIAIEAPGHFVLDEQPDVIARQIRHFITAGPNRQ